MPEVQLIVVEHPVVAHRLAELRDKHTSNDRFRALAKEISTFLAYEAFRGLAVRDQELATPLTNMNGAVVADQLLVVPILRAGLGMVPAVQSVVPNTEVAHLGMRRNETTLDAITYLDGLPADLTGRWVVLCDPMLATGGSLGQAGTLVEQRSAARITALCLIASAPGLERFKREHPSVTVVCAAVDPELNDRGYIVPGLGDAGDRMFGPPPP
jgi:uracil phosphoribosyltransferase